MKHPPLRLAATVVAAVVAACANPGGGTPCPGLGGTYADKAEGSGERLSALLLPGQPGHASARAVTLTEEADRQHLVVAAGAERITLQKGPDFTCDAHGLRLARPVQSELDLGEMLVHEVSTFHTFSKGSDGALLDSMSTKERAKVGGVPLAGPERAAATVRWRPLATSAAR